MCLSCQYVLSPNNTHVWCDFGYNRFSGLASYATGLEARADDHGNTEVFYKPLFWVKETATFPKKTKNRFVYDHYNTFSICRPNYVRK